jgi:hypothetical protein
MSAVWRECRVRQTAACASQHLMPLDATITEVQMTMLRAWRPAALAPSGWLRVRFISALAAASPS